MYEIVDLGACIAANKVPGVRTCLCHDTYSAHQGVEHDDLVFSQIDGKPLLPDSITHVWMKLARRSGLNGIRLHDARHTHATLMLKAGVHPKVVSERLGHANIGITLDIYK